MAGLQMHDWTMVPNIIMNISGFQIYSYSKIFGWNFLNNLII